MPPRIYLDNNGSTALDPRICELLNQSMLMLAGNPSSTHSFGQRTRALISKARDTIAAYLHVKPTEVVFTSGGTEGANMVLKGIMQKPGGHLITSTVEHSCVYATAQFLEKNGTEVTFLAPGPMGAVTPEAVKAAIRPNTQLIALMAVNNETGVKTDIEAIAAIAQEASVKLFVDGVALLGKETFVIPAGVSAMSFSGHKCHAPSGVGIAVIRSGIKLQPLLIGGEQEFGRRAGTENVLGIVALGKAVELLSLELPRASQQMKALRDLFEQEILRQLPNVHVNGSGPRTVNVSNLAFAGCDGEALLIALDAAGVSASHGSACSSGALEPSRILLNMGIPLELVKGSIRFSLSRFTTEEEILRAVEIIVRVIKKS